MTDHCKTMLQSATDLSERDIDQILRDLREVKKRYGQQRAAQFAKDESDADVAEAARKKENAQRALQAFHQSTAWIDAKSERVGSDVKAFESFMSDKVWNEQNAEWSHIERMIKNDLDRISPNLVGQLKNPSFSDNIIRELAGNDTGSDEAKGAAEAFKKYRESERTRANNAGANIGEIEGYSIAQSHDDMKIVKKGGQNGEQWIADILPKLDPLETFGAQEPEQFLREVYRDILSGMHERLDEDAHKGSASLANRLSRKRVLHFKDADSFIEYNAKYGKGTTAQGLMDGIRKLNQSAILMENMGPNPDHMFDRLMTHYRIEGRGKEQFIGGGQRRKLENRYNTLSLANDIASSPGIAHYSQGARNLVALSKLGGVFLHSLPDLGTSAFNLQYNGINIGSAFTGLFENLLTHKNSDEILPLLDFGMEAFRNQIASRWTMNEPGALSGAVNTFFRWNGSSWWTDKMKAGNVKMLSRHLSDLSDKSYGEIDSRLRGVLGDYGIDETAWDHIRKSEKVEAAGHSFITADNVADEKAASALRQYYVNEADRSIATPGVRERAIVAQSSQRGTIPGEAMRFMWQFHMYSLSMVTKLWPRAHAAPVPAAINLGIMGTMLGYISNSLVNMTEGKMPQDPTNPKTWAAAITTGSGAAFLGDLFFHNFNSKYGSLSSTLAGPVIGGAFNSVGNIYSMATSGKEKEASHQLVNFIRYNAPFSNLFYTKAAENYLLWYQLQEMMNPGSLQRMEAKQKKKAGTEYYLPPSSVVGYGGGFR